MTHGQEVASGERFEFGENWKQFLSVLDDQRITVAEDSLKTMLGTDSLEGSSFLDVGSGSGLFSLAARRLGARVVSFDYDPQSVACTTELKRRYFEGDPDWRVETGSVLDAGHVRGLGTFDIVYSWGVLHHTGAMWDALDNVSLAVAPGGKLFIAIYNDQGGWSRRWLAMKRTYNRLPSMLKAPYASLVLAPRELLRLATMTAKGKPGQYFGNIAEYSQRSARGMSYRHDLIDWLGGYPFEVAQPEEIFEFYETRGFQLTKLKTRGGGSGCNEFVFRRSV